MTGMVAITTFQIQAPRCSATLFCPVVTERRNQLRLEQASGSTMTRCSITTISRSVGPRACGFGAEKKSKDGDLARIQRGERFCRHSEEAVMRKDIEFKTEDGVTLRGWHYLPDGRQGKLPTIVMAHVSPP